MTSTSFRSILVPVDFSDTSERALEAATRLADDVGARITVMHVVHIPVPALTLPPTEMAGDLQRLQELAEDAAREAMDELLGRMGLKGRAHTVISDGEPCRAIVARARSIPADLVVVGTHGRTGLSRLVMGSVAEKVVRHAPCPVLVVRPSAEEVARARAEDEGE